MAAVRYDLFRKTAQRLLVANVPHKIRILLEINGADLCSGLFKFLTDAFTNAVSTAGDHDYFIFKHARPPSESRP